MSLDANLTISYNYEFDESLIAKKPIFPKEDASLLVYNRKNNSLILSKFGNLFEFIPKNTAILLNDTKVIKARIFGQKQTGGKIELLLNSSLENNKFSVFIKGKISQDSKINFQNNISCKILNILENGLRIVEFYKNKKILTTFELYWELEHIGHIPLPPYIKRQDNKDDEENYQSVFAQNQGAVAAPTASLHFSSKMLENLKNTYKYGFLTLHVGSGTFKPVNVENIYSHKMHNEFFNIPQASLDIINSNENILAIGTTVTRTIEYYSRTKKTKGECNLFLNPNNPPVRTNYILTNFHLPKSTLIMLVASFIGLEKTLEIYKFAVENKLKFYSYGDCMLIL